jgi:hypothetical protein
MQGLKKIRSTDWLRDGLACKSGERAHCGDHADVKPLVAQGCSGGGDRKEVEYLSDRGIASRGRSRRIVGVVSWCRELGC